MLKKLLFSFLTGLILLFSFAPYFQAKAQTTGTTWYNQTFQEWHTKVYDTATNPSEIFGERYTAAQVQWIVYSLISFVINEVVGPQNSDILNCFMAAGSNLGPCITELKNLLAVDSSKLPKVANQPRQNLLSLVFATDRPISGIGYIKEKFGSLSLVPTVHAQTPGTGFNALKPVQDLWRAFRDISFGLFVIVAIVFAFMIMFRVKLSPQTVISVQSALPKIIISLILVTFSYAIAGFLIDLMYVVIGLVSIVGSQFIFHGAGATGVFNLLTLGQPVGANVQIGVFGLLTVYLILFCVALIILLILNVGLVGSAVSIAIPIVLLGTGIGEVLLIIAVIAAVIISVITLWMMLKVMWGLLKAFANILLLTIFAPLQLTFGTFIPSLSFGSWIKNYISNLAVFVVTGVLILFAFIFVLMGVEIAFSDAGSVIISLIFGSGATGSLLGMAGQAIGNNINAWPPLLGTGGTSGVGLLFVIVSFVIFTMIPKANELIQAFLSGKPMAYGTSIGELTGPAGSTYAAYGANQIMAGGLPAPLGRIPGATTWMRGQSPEQRKQWAETLQNFFRPRH